MVALRPKIRIGERKTIRECTVLKNPNCSGSRGALDDKAKFEGENSFRLCTTRRKSKKEKDHEHYDGGKKHLLSYSKVSKRYFLVKLSEIRHLLARYSEFHDADLENLTINVRDGALLLDVRVEECASGESALVSLKFSGLTDVQLRRPEKKQGFDDYEFPTNSEIDSLKLEEVGGQISGSLRGAYGWECLWLASGPHELRKEIIGVA